MRYVWVHIYRYIQIYAYVYILYTHIYIDACIRQQICIFTYSYTYLKECMYIYIYVFAYSLVKSSTISLFVNLHWLYQRKAVHFRNTLSLKCLQQALMWRSYWNWFLKKSTAKKLLIRLYRYRRRLYQAKTEGEFTEHLLLSYGGFSGLHCILTHVSIYICAS